MLSKKAIEKYRQIYREEYDKEIGEKKAKEQGTRLLNFFKLLIEIDQRNKNSSPNKRDKYGGEKNR